jgi:general secretion pathway protein N
MIRRLEPLSWLLVAIAGWGLLCAIVALGGFGGRYSLLADDPKLAPPLPKVPLASARTPLGPLEAYAEASNRPLFYPDRKPIAVHVAGQTGADAQPLDVTLTSIVITPSLQMAIVQDNKTKQSLRVREGQALGSPYAGWKMVGMTPRSVVFDGGSQGQMTLELRVFDGQGGEEPTQMGLTPQAIANGAVATATPRLPANGGGNTDPPQPADAPQPVDASQTQAPTDATNAAANAAATEAANNAANVAAQQAEQIRRRIEERRQRAQAQGGGTPPSNDKVQ